MESLGDRYTLTTELGRGGMAVVHRARDARHGRDVAVKVMLPLIAESVGPDRFLREIETAARLQHPHIVPVFDSGMAGDQMFFVMPLIEGESLRGRLLRERRLNMDEAVRFVREVADALDYAHAQGVVHRDLKPENILISRGHALLVDFGIARAPTPDGSTTLTQHGTSLGTPSYMSPEQAAGDPDIGPASDIYALGCVLFELLTGEPPFGGESYRAILVKRFTQEAPRVRSRRPDVPEAVDAAIARALEREPEARFSTAHEFAEALVTPAAVGTGQSALVDHIGDRSVAVLPFDNLSPDTSDAYLADGLTEELIADLSRVTALRVIARNSSVAAYQRTKNLKEIARMLDVRYLLEGSVRRAGKQLRITAQLIDGMTDAHVWAEKYRGTIDDVFEMQERISASIVGELRTRLTEREKADRATHVTDAETYELYLRAKHMLGQSVMRLPEATALLESVSRRDPRFGPAYCAMAMPLMLAAMFNYIEPQSAWARIQSLADQALVADAESGAAHELLGAVAIYRDHDWSKASRLYERALELEPGAGFDRFLYAFFLAFRGDVREALRVARAGRKLDPLSFVGFLTESLMLVYTGDFDAALPLAERPSELDPQFPEGYHINGYVLLGMKEYERAIGPLTRAVQHSNRGAWPLAKLGCAYVHTGRVAEARALLDELEQRAAEATMSDPAVATLHLHLGERAAFFHAMHRGIDRRDPWAVSLQREFLWDPARGDPEFARLLERVGLA